MSETSVSVASVLELREADVDIVKGVLTLTVIEAGLNLSQTVFYPAKVLERDKNIFANAKMFLNHPTFMEELERPEGDLANWVAQLKEVWWDGSMGAIRGRAKIVDPTFQEKARKLAETGELKELGVSIRAFGEGERKNIDGIKHKVLEIEKLTAARSVDFVTFPGAGGKVEVLESALMPDLSRELLGREGPIAVKEIEGGGQVDDLKDLTAEEIRESRPDLVAELQEAKDDKELDDMRVKEISDLKKQLRESQERTQVQTERAVNAEKERDELRPKLEEAEKRERVKAVQESLDTALRAVELPEVVVKRIRARFDGAQSPDGIVEAIRAERDYVLELKRAGTVRDIDIIGDDEKEFEESDTSLEEIFSGLGFDEDAAKIAAAGRF